MRYHRLGGGEAHSLGNIRVGATEGPTHSGRGSAHFVFISHSHLLRDGRTGPSPSSVHFNVTAIGGKLSSTSSAIHTTCLLHVDIWIGAKGVGLPTRLIFYFILF